MLLYDFNNAADKQVVSSWYVSYGGSAIVEVLK